MNLIKFLLAQSLSWLLLVILTVKLHLLSVDWSYVAWLQGLFAALIGWILRQPYWWLPLNLLFFPAAILMLTLDVPTWIYLGIATVLTLIFWGTIKGDVPLFLSSPQVTAYVAQIVAQEKAFTFADLGAGVGSVAVPVARTFPHLIVDAWERAPLPWLVTRWCSRFLTNLHVYRSSFWACNLRQYNVVFAFLSPIAMPELGIKAKKEMRPGSLLISSSFPIIDWEPECIQQLDDPRKTTLYFYRLP